MRPGALWLRGGRPEDDADIHIVRALEPTAATLGENLDGDEAEAEDFGDTRFMFPQEKASGIPHIVRPITR